MSATLRVLCGPTGSGKTARLRELCLRQVRGEPGSALWLGPTRRAVDAMRTELLQDGGSIVGLHALAFGDFLDHVVRRYDPAARTLSDVQRRLLTEELLAALHADGRVRHFERVLEMRGFGDGLLGLLEELRRAGVSPAAFAESAGQVGIKGGPCAAVYASYDRELARRRLLDREASAWHACELLRRGLRPPYAGVRALFVDGFTDFTPAQSAVLAVLADSIQDIWISLLDEPGDERAELFARPRQTWRQLQSLTPMRDWLADEAAVSPLPAGLTHLERHLFRPLQNIEPAEDAAGLEVVEAPGVLGEVRLVARRVKSLLREGTAADEILVVARDLAAYADVVREVFGEYAIPTEIEGTEPLTRNPAVALVLRAMHLPDDNWPFAGVTALLRHTYFRPDWEETTDKPNLPQRAETLLRLLGVPHGRDAYLSAADVWADKPQTGLEDESAEESRRRRTHDLAVECQAFLHRFFRAWDAVPGRALIGEHAAWLKSFATEIGLVAAAAEHARDRAALALLFDELEQWQIGDAGRRIDRKTFLRRITVLASAAGLPRTPAGPGRVRVLSAAQARPLSAHFVFLVGLGERGFPRLTPPPSLFDDAERQALVRLGLPSTGAADLLPEEMLLFYQVVTRARRRLVLSYPAVDERGHALLPGSFLSAVLACFQPSAVPTERRNMLIEGYDRDVPLSAAEYRVRIAAGWKAGAPITGIAGDVGANLADAANLVRLRFREREHNPYDGLFRNSAVIADVAHLFGAEHIFSPTALEDYIACPFKFFLRHALDLEPLEEPREEIEVTRRGQAFHRALARLHSRLKEEEVHLPTDAVSVQAQEEITRAVDEYVHREPGPAAKELWRLEGQRLLRPAARYGVQWQRFVEPWLEKGIAPRPHHFEVDFGLPPADGSQPYGPLVIRAEGVEIRISGRIDRVDVAELPDGTAGFWIIDYKTGKSTHYTGADLAAFRRLQLSLYALAVEEVLLAGRPTQPLGLAYWMVGEQGPKVALPTRNEVLWLTETAKWRSMRETLQRWVAEVVAHIRAGSFPLQPRSDKCTETCDYGQVCRIAQARAVGKIGGLNLPDAGSP